MRERGEREKERWEKNQLNKLMNSYSMSTYITYPVRRRMVTKSEVVNVFELPF